MSFKYIIDTAMGVSGMTTPEEIEYLARLAFETYGQIVEVGSYQGRTAIALCMGQARRAEKNPPVLCVDPFENYEAVSSVAPGHRYDGEINYRQFINNVARYNVRHFRADSREVVAGFSGEVSLLWLDGQHDYEHVKADLEAWLPKLKPQAVVAFHDNNEAGVGQLLKEMQADRRWLEIGGARLITAMRWYPDAKNTTAENAKSAKNTEKSTKKKTPTASVEHWSDEL